MNQSSDFNLVILDLEWNSAYSRRKKGYLNEIIEFGAVRVDEQMRVTDRFSCLVHPQVTKRLNSITTDLTHITDAELENASPFMQAVSRFRRWAGDCVIGTWGSGDILTLIENCRYFAGDGNVPFLHRYADIQAYAAQMLGKTGPEQLGLQSAAEYAGVDSAALDHHRALDDSILSAMVLMQFFTPESFQPYVQVCDEEFYRRITFKTRYITDPDSPLIPEDAFHFTCEKCGAAAKRIGRWSVQGRGIRASFACPDCGYRFHGLVRAKLKYEGVTVNRKATPMPVIEAPRADAKPGEIGNMRLEMPEGVGLLRFPAWETLPGVIHCFSTRLGGVSEKEFAALNLGFTRGDRDENIEENLHRFAKAAGVPMGALTSGKQDHHTVVLRITEREMGAGFWKSAIAESADGLITNLPGIALFVYVADCVPLFFYDPEHRAIGLSHAGWRGTAGGMAKVTVERMQEEFGTDPMKLLAAIGPSIGPEKFEVDTACAEVFIKLPGYESFVRDDGNGKFHVDLWTCNRMFLLESGVLPENITVGGVCTATNSDLVFSHRVTRGKRGSNGAVLMLRSDA